MKKQNSKDGSKAQKAQQEETKMMQSNSSPGDSQDTTESTKLTIIQEESMLDSNSQTGHKYFFDTQYPQEIEQDPKFSELYFELADLREAVLAQNIPELNLPPEDDNGNVEYKLKLADPQMDRVEHLATQMAFRLNEGYGEAFYQIGVEDNGVVTGISDEEIFETLIVLFYMANSLGATLKMQKVRIGHYGTSFELQVIKPQTDMMKPDIKITLFGAEYSGKSTLLGVLVSGVLDDGEGSQRSTVIRHPHELLKGFTSSVSMRVMGFNSKGQITNRQHIHTWAKFIQESSKLITFIDVSGKEKYLKTAIKGVSSYYPDYVLMIVDAKEGITPITLNHLRLAFSCQKPVIIVLSKVDLATKDELFDVEDKLSDYIKNTCSKKIL